LTSRYNTALFKQAKEIAVSSVNIRVRDNGPLLVEGPITLVDAEGKQLTIPEGKPAIALCRCGHSQNKPFCDGAHKSNDFQSCVRAVGLDSKG
jgi:CDGSH-type Zn-finger protein